MQCYTIIATVKYCIPFKIAIISPNILKDNNTIIALEIPDYNTNVTMLCCCYLCCNK